MTYEERNKKLEELENEAKSWGASEIIPWRKDYLNGGGVTICYDNGYCADICLTDMSYGNQFGLFEFAIMTYIDNKIGEMVFDTPITDDVLGGLTIEECKNYCQQVKELTLHDALKHANKNLQNTVNELNNALNKI